MKAKLVSPASSPLEWEIELEQFPVVIGRSSDAEIQPLDASVSERHCELEAIRGHLVVRDLGSEYGTFVNGEQVEIASLLPGDRLTIGESSFVASYDLPPRETPLIGWMAKANDSPILGRESSENATFFDLVSLLERQREVYGERYHRELCQKEPLFPDPPHPEHIEHLIAEEMRSVGAEPRFIYAFEKTGVLLTEFNYHSISDDKCAEWQAAVEEYEDRYGCREEAHRYPVGAVTMYGPDKSTTTMIVAAVMTDEDTEPVYKRWVGSEVSRDCRVKRQIDEFFLAHDVRSVIYVRENVGCPHQEGLDYPSGEDCPFCPSWSSP